MGWVPVVVFGGVLLVGTVALWHLARAVKHMTATVEAMRVMVERECGSGDEY